MLILAGRFVFGTTAGPEQVALRVVDAYTGQALPGVAIAGGEAALTSDGDGRVQFDEPDQALRLSAALSEYADGALDVVPDGEAELTVPLRPTTLRGVVTDAASGAPLPGIAVLARGPDGREVTATTGDDGSYVLNDVPAEATLALDGGDYGTIEEALGARTDASFALRVTTLAGVITDAAGDPVQGAIVTAGDARGASQKDGRYRLTNVPDAAEVRIAAPGYLDAAAAVPAERQLDIALEPIMVKAVYANAYTLADPDEVARIIELVDSTELNAIVIDIKQDTIYYDSQVPFFLDIEGMVVPLYDVDELLAELRERNIYAIARMVVFQDPLVANARPDLAVRDDITGDLWRNHQDVGWVNAFEEELWDANIALAVEAAARGFDEIQYDYVRFPSDGDLTTADFGQEYTAEARQAAITSFMARSYEAIKPTGAKFAADLFGYIGLVADEQGIGQHFASLVQHLDYVCMMIYPSHFIVGNIQSADGHPNDFPYETIFESLERASSQIPDESRLKFRPWLQDFSIPGLSDYGPDEVAAQIKAAEDFGASGWLLWNPSNEYSVAALDPA